MGGGRGKGMETAIPIFVINLSVRFALNCLEPRRCPSSARISPYLLSLRLIRTDTMRSRFRRVRFNFVLARGTYRRFRLIARRPFYALYFLFYLFAFASRARTFALFISFTCHDGYLLEDRLSLSRGYISMDHLDVFLFFGRHRVLSSNPLTRPNRFDDCV